MCDCITKMNEALKEKGVYLDTTCIISGSEIVEKPRIRLLPREGRMKKEMPSVLSMLFCPMCGERYDQKSEAAK